MRNNLYKMLLVLLVPVLTACQAGFAAPGQSQTSEFFKGVAGQGISVTPPAGWVAKLGGNTTAPFIVVTDDWDAYQKTDNHAVGIIILPLTDEGSAEKVLRVSIRRFQEKDLLLRQTGEVRLEESNGQSYAWVEFQGNSIEKTGFASYFLAVVSAGQRNVLVFTSVDVDKQEAIRPTYQSTVKAITLH
jgi:hypothetical protein